MNESETVEVPLEKMPLFPEFAWSALVSAMSMACYWDGEDGKRMLAGEIEMVTTVDIREGVYWVWDHSGSGDFIRISSPRAGTRRWLVCFDHESERSPWGLDRQLPPGLEWVGERELKALRDSDHLLTLDGPMSACEIYSFSGSAGDYAERPPTWRTSPLIAAMKQDFSSRDPRFEEDDEQGALYQQLYERLLKEDYPNLTELTELMNSELAAAAALIAISRIREWLKVEEF